jgi:hypothetical protein
MHLTAEFGGSSRDGSRGRKLSGWRPLGALVPGLALVGAVLVLAACASSTSAPASALSPVPIKDFRSVAGRWAGPVSGLASSRRTDEDWVELTVADDGAYDFGIARTIGVFAGKGRFTLDEGKLLMVGERGRATYILYEGGGRRVLRASGTLPSGPVTAELTPKK